LNGGYSRADPKVDPSTQSLLYRFHGNEARSPGIVEFPIRVDTFNVVTEFYILDNPFPYNAILGRPRVHMMRAIPSTHSSIAEVSHTI